jgi:outer membrane protease
MRTVFLGVAALALCSGAAVAVEFGVDKPFSLEVETGLGLLYGAANEHVFKAATEDSRGGEISKLEWQEQFVPTANISGRAGWYGVFLGGSLRAAVSADAGRVLDTDYQNDAEMGHYPYLYADHVSHLDSHVDLQGELGYAVHLRFPAVDLRIAPSLGYFYRNRKWAASSGYHQVAVEGETWTGSEPKENIWGQVMSYEQALSSIDRKSVV